MRPTARRQAPVGARDAAQRSGGALGRHHVDQHARATFEAGLRDEVGPDVDVPVVLALVCVRRRVEPDVVGDVTDHDVEECGGVAQCAADGLERLVVGVLQMQLVAARHDQHLVRRAAPVRAQNDDVVIGGDDPLTGGHLGLERGAQQAVAGEAGEGALLVEHLTRHERQAEQLPVGMGERSAGLATVVDDRLRVADVGGRGVFEEAALERHHELARGVIVESVERLVVIGRIDEDLVNAGALGGDVHRAVVVDGEALLAMKRRVEVGHRHAPATCHPRRSSRVPAVWILRCRGRTGRACRSRRRRGAASARSRSGVGRARRRLSPIAQ